MPNPTTRLLVPVLLLALGACGQRPPDLATWTGAWHDAVALVPDQPADLTQSRCQELLADLRRAREDLIPAPDEELSAVVGRWLAGAEELAFECPPSEGFEASLDQLADMEREVSALLADG